MRFSCGVNSAQFPVGLSVRVGYPYLVSERPPGIRHYFQHAWIFQPIHLALANGRRKEASSQRGFPAMLQGPGLEAPLLPSYPPLFAYNFGLLVLCHARFSFAGQVRNNSEHALNHHQLTAMMHFMLFDGKNHLKAALEGRDGPFRHVESLS